MVNENSISGINDCITVFVEPTRENDDSINYFGVRSYDNIVIKESDKQKAIYQLLCRLSEAEKSILLEGTISSEELELELGV